MKKLGVGKIASLGGRYYGMDRDTNFDRVEKAYNAMVVGTSVKEAKKVWKESQKNKVTDEFIVPVTTDKNGLIKDNDGIIFFNYRPDRLKELASIFTNKEYKSFTKEEIKNLNLACVCNSDLLHMKAEFSKKNSNNDACSRYRIMSICFRVTRTNKYLRRIYSK